MGTMANPKAITGATHYSMLLSKDDAQRIREVSLFVDDVLPTTTTTSTIIPFTLSDGQ